MKTATTGRSIAARLTIGLVVVAFLVFAAVGLLLNETLQREMLRAERRDIEGKADVVRHFLDEAARDKDAAELRHRLDDLLIGDKLLRIWIILDDGSVFFGGERSPRMRSEPEGLTVWREDGLPLRGRRFRTPASAALPVSDLVIAFDTRERDHLMRSYRIGILLVCGLGLAVTVGLGAWVTRRELRPVLDLSREAAAISARALSVRLSVPGAATELQALVDSFNRALDRVEAAYEHLEAFNADVAHELRTPLAILISGSEVTLSRSRSAEELRETLMSNLEELRDLAAMVNDMLFLARADRGEPAVPVEQVDLREEARRVAEYFEATLEERQQTLVVHGEGSVSANAALVRRALVNLVSNASRHAPREGRIDISIARQEGAVCVTVRNPGPAIPAEFLPRLFDRFFRVDAARDRGAEQHGLGLAIVRAVARLHGGDTFASSSGEITEVGLSLSTRLPARKS